MKYLLVLGFVAAACTLAAQPKPGTGSVDGRVLNSLTNAPVRKAVVSLIAPQIWLTANTDAEGRFQFTALPPGTYKLSATLAGFLEHSARRPVTIAPNGHVTNAEIQLPPGGLITGNVTDADGDPMGGVRVTLFGQIYRDGKRQWGQLTTVNTNETGEYRFPSLRLGRYLVEAQDTRLPVNNQYGEQTKMQYVPAYYPNATSEDAASPVEVGLGAEVRGVDIHLFKATAPPSFTVSGKVIGAPPGSRILIVGSAFAEPPNYLFEKKVALGQQRIFAQVLNDTPEAYATTNVNVTGNLAGLVLTMNPPPDIAARVRVAESGSQVKLQGVSVSVTYATLNFPGGQSDAAGKLFERSFRPGPYKLNIDERSLPEGCFVQRVTLGGQEISPADFEIVASSQLEIVLSSTAGSITGSVSDDEGKPFSNSMVTLIPGEAKSPLVKQSADENGTFTFAHLRPGKYKLFAWEEVDDDLWQDPEFRKKYESRAREITVGPSETKNGQLRLIAAEEIR